MTANAILRSLPGEEFERLQPYLKPASLSTGQRISTSEEPLQFLWFPESGAVSRMVHLHNGETIEAGIVGNDGVVGLPIALGGVNGLGLGTVQVPGAALAISVTDFYEHVRARGGPLIDALTMYANLYIAVLSQLTACHALHRIEQRLSRCILTLSDYAISPSVRVTHDTLSEFLGVHRPSVTYALQSMAEGGAISLERRRIVILDRNALLSHACECYLTIRKTTANELERMNRALRGA